MQIPSKIHQKFTPEPPWNGVPKKHRTCMQKGSPGHIDLGAILVQNPIKKYQTNIENQGPKISCFLMPGGSKMEPTQFPKSMKHNVQICAENTSAEKIIKKTKCPNLEKPCFS
jgi:hypothetical protein